MRPLIATDLDGTLFQNGVRSVRTDLFPLIHSYVKRGGIFVVASGRQYPELKMLFQPVLSDISCICENGCQAYHGAKRVINETLDKRLCADIIDKIVSIEDVEARVSDGNVLYACPRGEAFREYTKDRIITKPDDDIRKRYIMVDSIKELSTCCRDVTVISAWSHRGSAYYVDRLRESIGEVACTQAGGDFWVDVIPNDVDKLTGMTALCDYLDIPLSDVTAIGDYYNDLTLLSSVGHPMCVDNAVPEIKALSEDCDVCGADLLARILSE